MMKALLLLLGLKIATGLEYSDLRAKFDVSGENENKKSFFQIPRTLSQAQSEGWLETKRAPGPIEELLLYCWPEYYVCALYHPCGFIAGIQIAFPETDLYIATFKRERWFKKWTIPATEDEPAKEYVYITQYFIPEDYSESDPQEENFATLPYGGIWIENPDDGYKFMHIPIAEKEILAANYTKQNCIVNMGTHYYYKMTKETLCENLSPWFGLVLNGNLMGYGLQFHGTLAKLPNGRQWLEEFYGKKAAKLAIPLAPECLYNSADIYTTISLHLYCIKEPWTYIRCRPEDSIASADV